MAKVDSALLIGFFTPMQVSGGVYISSPMELRGDGFKHTLHLLRGKIQENPLTRGNGRWIGRNEIDRMLSNAYHQE